MDDASGQKPSPKPKAKKAPKEDGKTKRKPDAGKEAEPNAKAEPASPPPKPSSGNYCCNTYIPRFACDMLSDMTSLLPASRAYFVALLPFVRRVLVA